MKINIGQKEIIHFIGIGGIGMSGLAQIMKIMGFKVQGSDISMNKNIENCKRLGIKFFLGQKKKNIKEATILVKSSAIKSNNHEVKEAKNIIKAFNSSTAAVIAYEGKMIDQPIILSMEKRLRLVGIDPKTID